MSAENLEVMWSPWEGPGLEHLRLRVGEGGIEPTASSSGRRAVAPSGRGTWSAATALGEPGS
jgi:hypothetical protein